jgi:hypothetical protein
MPITNFKERRRLMRSKDFFLMVFGLLFLLLTGCGGGGTSTGSSSSTYQTIVGTWNETAYTGDGVNLPTQLIFNENGTGSFSGATSGSANFTWVYQGTTLTLNPTGRASIVLTAPQVGTVVSPLTLTTSTRGTVTYTR